MLCLYSVPGVSTVTITLTPEQEKSIAQAVASGLYRSADEVIGTGLEKLQADETWKAYAKARIAKGLEDLSAGRTTPREQFLARVSDRRREEA